MKKLLLTQCLLLIFFTASVAQEKSVLYRTGDAFSGPVKSARIETATFSKRDGVLVEGPRRLVVAVSYSPDGKRKEYEGYAPDGTLRQKYVCVYDDEGRLLEQSNYDGQNKLLGRMVYRREPNETLIYDGDGSLRQRVVPTRSESGGVEIKTYDGSGALLRRMVITREADRSVGRLMERTAL